MPIFKNPSILVMNAGSSGIKFALFNKVGGQQSISLIARGQIRQINQDTAISFADTSGEKFEPKLESSKSTTFDSLEALPRLIARINEYYGQLNIHSVGHRVVHGGTKYLAPVLISPSVLSDLEGLIPLSPLHQPACLQAIRITQNEWPDAHQIACFDTTFHCEQMWVARALGLPREITELGVERYGFHGLSMEYVTSQLTRVLGERANGKIIVAHLGNGASLCAIKDGKSVTSTMGFSALDGLIMGTRCGTLDPGVILYLLQHLKMTDKQISEMLYQRSGLLGVSGISSDVQVLLKSKEPAALQAIDLFVYRLLGEVGSLAAAMGGLDALVFTGGIGENSASIRERVVEGCQWLGASLDPVANRVDLELIHGPESKLQIAVVATDEEQMIALHSVHLLKRHLRQTEQSRV
jgi:acetate kinase